MALIRVLPPELASQIAAGEVVERPASVAKELIENAFDARAQRVVVSVRGGGMELLEVSDDGSGMAPDDARLCLERHATSKLRSFDDLERLVSYGFRGEALPSIASVSRLVLKTRDQASEAGMELVVEGGMVTGDGAVGCAVGTTVSVRELFFNVPARLKFLRSVGTEAGHVADVVADAALARPDVTLVFERDGRTVRNFARVSERRARAEQVFEGCRLRAFVGQKGPLEIAAYLSDVEQARQGALGLKWVVNGRVVRDRALAGAVAHAWGERLPKGKYPRGVVYLDLPPELVDVNVHPQKHEVRFAQARAVAEALVSLLAAGPLAGHAEDAGPHGGPARGAGLPPRRAEGNAPSLKKGTSPSVRLAPTSRTTPRLPYLPPKEERAYPAPEAIVEADLAVLPLREPVLPGRGRLRYLAQVKRAFWVCEGTNGLVIVDQHAAAERSLSAAFWSQYEGGSVRAQTLLFPLTGQLSSSSVRALGAFQGVFESLGIEIRPLSGDVVTLHSVPDLLGRAPAQELFAVICQFLERPSARKALAKGDAGAQRELARALVLELSCRFSLQAGQPVTAAEAQAILQALDGPAPPDGGPHAEPFVGMLGFDEMARKAGRSDN